jgi:hypothetical protein
LIVDMVVRAPSGSDLDIGRAHFYRQTVDQTQITKMNVLQIYVLVYYSPECMEGIDEVCMHLE